MPKNKDKLNMFYVNRWRQSKGNDLRKSKYLRLKELGVSYKDRSIMRFWSEEKIEEWLKNNLKVVDNNG